MMDRLEEMFLLQEALQQRHLDGGLPHQLTGETRANYIRTMVLATTDELHEALRNTQWKPWSNRDVHWSLEEQNAYVDELIDAWHFFMNLLLVAGVNADEFFNGYLRKNNINHGRIDDGYISTTG
jgi:dimeric dUTPase (all-alpha-NTP-PPase superfamily)